MSDNEMSYEEWETLFKTELEYMNIVSDIVKQSFENERKAKSTSKKIVQPSLFDQRELYKKNTLKKNKSTMSVA